MNCSRCGFATNQPSPFCPACGSQTGFAFSVQNLQTYPPAPQSASYAQQPEQRRGFSQLFGIHPAIATLTFIVDMMLFGGEVATMGAILPVSIGAGAMLGLIAYLAQRRWYGDDKDSAAIKALILGFLTAIPMGLPAMLTVPSGIIWLVRKWRKM